MSNYRREDSEVEQMFFDRFDAVNPILKNEQTYDELRDMGTTYLGTTGFTRGSDFPIKCLFKCDPWAWTLGHLLDGTLVPVQIDTGATKCIMSKGFFNEHEILHDIPRYKAHTKNLEIGNGAYISIKFIIPLVISFNGHIFEIFALVNSSKTSELLLIGMKT